MSYEEKLPQYTSALGGFTAALAAQHHLPKKYRGVGQIAGTVVGTGAGIEGGELLGRHLDRARARRHKDAEKAASAAPAAAALWKLAQLPDPPPDSGEAPQDESPIWGGVKRVGAGLMAFGAGTAAGYGAQLGIEKLLGRQATPARLRAVAPVLGGGLGLAYNQYKALEAQELRRAIEAYKNQSARPVPAE